MTSLKKDVIFLFRSILFPLTHLSRTPFLTPVLFLSLFPTLPQTKKAAGETQSSTRLKSHRQLEKNQ